MTTVYVANFATLAMHDAEMDDPSARDMRLVDFASPQVAGVHVTAAEGQLPSASWIAEMRALVEAEVREEYDDKDLQVEWNMSGWETPAEGRPYTEHFLCDDEGICAVLVIQQMDAS